MIGNVTVLEPAAYQAWLQGGGVEGTLASAARSCSTTWPASTCHLDTGQGRGPSLKDIVGKPVELAGRHRRSMVDEGYLRESILNSQAKIVKGFQPLMPTFQGLISEENLVALIEHVKSLSPQATTAAAPMPASGSSAPRRHRQPRRRTGARRSKPCSTHSRFPSATT